MITFNGLTANIDSTDATIFVARVNKDSQLISEDRDKNLTGWYIKATRNGVEESIIFSDKAFGAIFNLAGELLRRELKSPNV